MWAIIAVSLHLLAGPDTWAVTEAGTFDSEDACKAEIAKSVPAKLKNDDKKAYEDGHLKYVCVKVVQ